MSTEAQQIANSTANKASLEADVFWLLGYGGLINDEIADTTGKRQGAISGAITALREAGKVKDSGEKRHGRDALQTVWVLGDDRDVVRRHRLVKLAKLLKWYEEQGTTGPSQKVMARALAADAKWSARGH